MKKKFLSLLFVAGFASVGMLYAAPVDDTQFDAYVQLTKKSKSNPPGMTVVADKTYRIMYVSMPMAVSYSSVTPDVIAKMKNAMRASMKKSNADLKVIRDLKISLVYTFITTDKKVFSISFSYLDF
jgi:aspartate aminotransferase-like enzyme